MDNKHSNSWKRIEVEYVKVKNKNNLTSFQDITILIIDIQRKNWQF